MIVTTRPAAAQTLRRAVVQARLAPSVHNTQPWHFVLGRDFVELHAELDRRLPVLDPSGRQLTISVGCALFNLRVALAAAGFGVRVDRLPGASPTLLARLTLDPAAEPAAGIAALDAVIELRRTNRRRFAPDPVPLELVTELTAAASAEHSELVPILGIDERIATAVLSQRADGQQNADPAYRAELRAWTTADPTRVDGVPAVAVPHAGADPDEVPIRDFDTAGVGALPADPHSDLGQCLLLLGTAGDDAAAWLRAGEALERVLLEITRHGFVASPLTQVVEVVATRAALRNELQLTMYPHVLLRVGRAAPTPAPRRRRLVDMLDAAREPAPGH